MAPLSLKPGMLAAYLPKDSLILVQGCSGESEVLAAELRQAGNAAGAAIVTGIFVPGLNRTLWLANGQSGIRTFFLTPELRKHPAQVEFLPLCYADILAHLRQAKIGAALFQVAPPDAAGICSFGPIVDFLAELWPRIPVRIAQINPAMPRVKGHPGIPYREITACIEAETPLLGMADAPPDAIAAAIAAHIAGFVPDGATLQTGLGRIPGAMLRALRGHRGLRLHSGLVGDAVLDLAQAGALAAGAAIEAGVAIGSPKLYAAVAEELFRFRPVSHTHDPLVLAKIPNLVTVNSALSVDLFGQGFAELTSRGLLSGPGGASDFSRGAKAANGLRVLALPAMAEGVSRIVLAGQGAGPVSLGRMDSDLIVTEYGAADLRGRSHAARAQALIGIAAPAAREGLAASWREYSKIL